ncbi:MAG: hypothetical protein COZ27_01380, partial [Candidatus Moranbacteria bacterium CG_4_10_14_3_um_filter_41_65]
KKQLQQLFWDVDEDNLASLEGKTVITRVFFCGTFAHIQGVFSSYDKHTIQEVFRNLKSGAISPRRYDYFSLILL